MKSVSTLFIIATATLMSATTAASALDLGDADVENLVKLSYQYVAVYRLNNEVALKQGGWNTCDADIAFEGHTTREIARSGSDSLCISCLPNRC